MYLCFFPPLFSLYNPSVLYLEFIHNGNKAPLSLFNILRVFLMLVFSSLALLNPCVQCVCVCLRERDDESQWELGVALGLHQVCAIGSIHKSGASPLLALRHWGFLPITQLQGTKSRRSLLIPLPRFHWTVQCRKNNKKQNKAVKIPTWPKNVITLPSLAHIYICWNIHFMFAKFITTILKYYYNLKEMFLINMF